MLPAARAFPDARVVKTLNTVNALVMVNPQLVAGGDHHVFVSGNDAGAKAEVTAILEGLVRLAPRGRPGRHYQCSGCRDVPPDLGSYLRVDGNADVQQPDRGLRGRNFV